MKLRLPFFLALACLAIAMPVQASMHPNAAVDGLAHFMWHMQMTAQAAQTGNWTMFWQLFTEQSVCTNVQSMTFIFTPAFFITMVVVTLVAMLMLIRRLVRKAPNGWWNQFRQPNYAQ
jgi:hypothetical protein